MLGRAPRRLALAPTAALITLLIFTGLLWGVTPRIGPRVGLAAGKVPALAAYVAAPLVPQTFTVTNTNDSGAGSLRQAILDANANPGADTIAFQIGSGIQAITPTSPLPAITDPVTIDGTTQPGYAGTPLVELLGDKAGGDGLNIQAGGTTVRALAVSHFNTGIHLQTLGGDSIKGCYVGLRASGAAAGNGSVGVFVASVSNNVIGGTTAADRNVISGSSEGDLLIDGGSNNTVSGNYVGTNAAGDAPANSAGDGVALTGGASGNTVGGTNAGAGNLISGHTGQGVLISDLGTDNNVVAGNLIGTNAGGTSSIHNGIGVYITTQAANNRVGGTSNAARNVISGNSFFGVKVDAAATGNTIKGNFIGTQSDGTSALANGTGVLIAGASGNTVGGTNAGAGNRIAFNTSTGVRVGSDPGDSVTGDRILGDSIHDNGSLGIDLGGDGVTPNDAQDADTGPNNLQNFPVINSAKVFGENAVIQGTLNSTPSTSFTLQFFSNTVCNASGNGEGKTFLGSATVKTDAGGNAPFNVTLSNISQPPEIVTATATDASGNTSEFSACASTGLIPSCGSAGFAAATNRPAGSAPTAVVTGDFNGDGKQDIAVTDQASNTVSVLLGDGAGGFGAATSFNVGANPLALAVGDFNGDGKLDLVTVNSAANTVSVLLGNGNGGFAAATDFNVGNNPAAVAVGDFNGDGKPDVVTANSGPNDISLLLGDGAGNFAAATDFNVGNAPGGIAVGDFNNDGNLDVATSNRSSNNVSVLLGDGTGKFGAATNFGVSSQPASVTVGDFNGDGKLDLVAAEPDANAVSVLLGDGAGGFGASNNFGVGTFLPISVVVGDFNGDGVQDLAAADLDSSAVSVLAGNGNGGFGAAKTFNVGTDPFSIASADFNGDGKPDLVAANNGSNDASVLLNSCTTSNATYVVNSTGDGGDSNTADNACNDGTGHCTLRAAIQQANANPGADTIQFNIPGAGVHTIAPASPLPAVSDRVTIDGYTQPGSSANTLSTGDNAVILVELDGTNAGANANGLDITSGNSTVRGLAVKRFGNRGIFIDTQGGNTVQGCFIGTDAAGASAAGNGAAGVETFESPNNQIGGTTPASRNVISGNSGGGIVLTESGKGNTIQGNYVGTDKGGASAIGNGGNDGIAINGPSNATVGGTSAGAANTIAFNRKGVVVTLNGIGDSILSNSIHDNTDLGIDLGADGVTPNDAQDADTGPNNLQNFPALTSATYSGGSTVIQGTLNSTPNSTFRVEFFSNTGCDPSGNGEGQTLIGSANVTTDASGNANINSTLAATLSSAQRVTATATNSTTGDTSEFSPCVAPVVTATWTGAVSADWHTPGNWDTNAVPAAADSVVIPSPDVPNEPAISSADAAAASVNVQSGRTLTIGSARTLTATTIVINTGATVSVPPSQNGFVNAAVTNSGTVGGGASNSFFFFLGPSLVNNGTVDVGNFLFRGATQTLSGTGTFSGAVSIINGASVTLASDHTLTTLSIANGTLDQGASSNLTAGPVSLSAQGTLRNLGTGDLTLSGDVSNSGTIQLNGGGPACGDADSILIRSSVAGAQRAWSGAGTFSLTDVDVRDQAGTASVQVLSGTNSGDNGPNWTFATCGGVPLTFSISGHVADANNQPLLGVNIHISGSATGDTTTDAAGDYTFTNLAQNGSYTLTPSETGYRFTPSSRSVSNLQSDQTGVDFAGARLDHTITGSVVDAQGAGLPGVTVTFAGTFSAVTRTDARGSFNVTNVPDNASFVITPTLDGFDFDPAHQQVAGATSDLQFHAVGTAQPQPTPTPDQSDDFSGGPDPDPNKWAGGILTNPPTSFDPLVEVFLGGGLLHIQPRADANGPSYNGLVSVRALDINSTPIVSVEVVQAAQGTGTETIFGLGTSSDNWFRFDVQDNTPAPTPTTTPTPGHATTTGTTSSAKAAGTGNDSTSQTLFFQFSIGGQKFSTGIPYDPAQHRFWRFRFDATARLIIFETSPDAATWTVRFSAPVATDQTSLIAELSAGTFRPSPSPVGALFDNFLLSPSPRMQFVNSAFNVRESDGTAQVQVIRTGSDENPVSVDFATSDGTARAGGDYKPVSGTLLFGIGERAKTINIPIIDDNVVEPDETVNLDLGNPVGARLGSITHAVLTILDDDASKNPLDQTAFFVRQQYLDFLGREPDADGFNFWTNNIESCGADQQCRAVKRIDTSAAFFLSIEFQQTGYVVGRFYEASFGRPPKLSEYLPDLTVMRDGVVVGQPDALTRLEQNQELFAEQWVTRPAFKQAFGSLNEMQYVDALAANAGVRLAEEDRTAFIVGLLTGRETRAGVLLQIVQNEDFAARDFNAAFVRMEYFGYLRRDPDDAGFQFWLSKLNRFGDFRTAEMVKAFLNSTEYRARFGPP
jgi:CSLREA domain-containing protein